MHPRSKHWHLIDYVICRRVDLKDFNVTKAMRGAECWTDHRLLRSVVKFSIRPPARKQKKKRTFDLSKFQDPACLAKLHAVTREAIGNLVMPNAKPDFPLDPPELDTLWDSFTGILSTATTEVIGFSQKKNEDWFDQNDETISSLLKSKNNAYQRAINNPQSAAARANFQMARSKCQRMIRRLKNEWWQNKATEIQNYADTNNQQGFYEAIKIAYGPRQNTNAPLLSEDGRILHKDSNAILERWTEYLNTLLNHQIPSTEEFIEDLPLLPTIHDLDEIPTLDEVTKACRSLKNGKAAGPDGLPGEVFKYADPTVIESLHSLI